MTASNPAMPFAPTGLAPVPSRAAAPEAAAIDLRGLSRSFGDKQVLRQVDLHVPAGQFLAIVGRSGCGKSTLLRILLGLDAPTSGAVSVGDGRRAGLSRIMFQEPRLLPWARVLDNVRVGAPRR
ncbi:ATP-binding cassette domain-containing protein, partial [Hansschlegelia beijingensis]|uniref:ATP-binding cassette domain-containing protein n=1 Tax=Hansschlegelia beijingensis TaxID=1133344 RepID=UPI00387F36AC